MIAVLVAGALGFGKPDPPPPPINVKVWKDDMFGIPRERRAALSDNFASHFHKFIYLCGIKPGLPVFTTSLNLCLV